MKLAILGTRGVPNHYGGFEQFAQYLSEKFVKKGHEVYVYNSQNHPYQKSEWNGVKIIHCKDPSNTIGTASQFIYDLNCIIDSRKRNYDIILQLGYTSSSIWNFLFPKGTIIVTNMDGLEWKRNKYTKLVQKFLLFAEKLAVKYSNYLISDSIAIQSYLKQKYSIESKYIPYGAFVVNNVDKQILKDFNVKENSYNILVARMEPENNIETILQGFVNSNTSRKFIVVGNTSNKYGSYITEKFKDSRIIYTGYIEAIEKLNTLRKYSYLYFHGHSVGGTNPSLLEAMSSSSLICAHNNHFNKAILDDHAFYFNCDKCVTSLLEKENIQERELYVHNNLEKIKKKYRWSKVLKEYENFLKSMI